MKHFKFNMLNDFVDESRFAGRKTELQSLYQLVSRQTRIISVVGDFGIGKTTLVRIFVKELAPMFDNLWTIGKEILHSDISHEIERLNRQGEMLAPLLVVIDNADELSPDLLRQQIRKIHNFGRVPTVILISRNSLAYDGEITEFFLESLTGEDFLRWAQLKNGVIYDLNEGAQETEQRIIEEFKPEIILLNDTVIRHLKKSPRDIYTLDPRKFEEVIAELLSDQGCEVEVTPVTGDGGKDILAWMNTPLGKVLALVEAKRFKESRPVGVELVRQLYGVLHLHGKASHAMMVTTSRFTKGAKVIQKEHEYELQLKDYTDVISWIAGYKHGN